MPTEQSLTSDERRSEALKRYNKLYRMVDTARIRELNQRGETDSGIAREMSLARCTVSRHRRLMGLSVSADTLRLIKSRGDGGKATALRRLRARERMAEVCRLTPDLSMTALRVVEAVALAGTTTRVSLSRTLGMSDAGDSAVAKELARLRRTGVLVRTWKRSPVTGAALPAEWSLAPTVEREMYTRGNVLSPVQQKLSADAAVGRYVQVFTARYARSRVTNADDIESAARTGIVQAARMFDPDRGMAFGAFAYRVIERTVLNVFRALRPLGRRGGEDRRPDPLAPKVWTGWTDTGDAETFPERTVPGSSVTDPVDSRDEFETMLSVLPTREQNILRMLFRDGYKGCEVARALDVSESLITKLVSRSLNRLRTRVENPSCHEQ